MNNARPTADPTALRLAPAICNHSPEWRIQSRIWTRWNEHRTNPRFRSGRRSAPRHHPTTHQIQVEARLPNGVGRSQWEPWSSLLLQQ
jgi:hypothetical protein